MPRMIVGFMLLWLVFYIGWTFLKQSSWKEKKIAFKGIFVAFVLACCTALTIGAAVALF